MNNSTTRARTNRCCFGGCTVVNISCLSHQKHPPHLSLPQQCSAARPGCRQPGRVCHATGRRSASASLSWLIAGLPPSPVLTMTPGTLRCISETISRRQDGVIAAVLPNTPTQLLQSRMTRLRSCIAGRHMTSQWRVQRLRTAKEDGCDAGNMRRCKAGAGGY